LAQQRPPSKTRFISSLRWMVLWNPTCLAMIGGGWVVVEKRRKQQQKFDCALEVMEEFCQGLRGAASTSSLCSDAIRKKTGEDSTSHNCK